MPREGNSKQGMQEGEDLSQEHTNPLLSNQEASVVTAESGQGKGMPPVRADRSQRARMPP